MTWERFPGSKIFRSDEKLLRLKEHILVTWSILLFSLTLLQRHYKNKDRLPSSNKLQWKNILSLCSSYCTWKCSMLPDCIHNTEKYGESFHFLRGLISFVIISHSVKWGPVMWQIGPEKSESWPRIWTFLSSVFRRKALTSTSAPLSHLVILQPPPLATNDKNMS